MRLAIDIAVSVALVAPVLAILVVALLFSP